MAQTDDRWLFGCGFDAGFPVGGFVACNLRLPFSLAPSFARARSCSEFQVALSFAVPSP